MDHVIQHLVDVSDGNSENPIAFGLEPSSLAAIGLVLVKRTIDLDREAGRDAEEVDEVRADGDLAPELVAVDLPVPQPRPEASLGFRHVVSKLSGAEGLR
jgi:hypothetical protein